MRDDQRPERERQDDINERFDEALDDLFGPDDEPTTAPPPATGQEPQPPGSITPPADVFTPDPEHEVHAPHQAGEGHFLGPGNQPPPPSYGIPTRAQPVPAEQAEPPTMTAGEPAPDTAPTPPAQRRNWRRIGCYGCLAIIGIPALCLGALVVLGLIVGDQDATPTPAANVDDPPVTAVATSQDTARSGADTRGEPYASISEGRPAGELTINGEGPFGSLERPVPPGYAAPVGDGWVVQVDAVIEDANELIAAENMFNEPPADGKQYLLAAVTATNSTGAPAVFEASFRLRLVGETTGTVYTTFDASDYCGVIPDPFTDDQIPSGSRASGNVCWQVRSEDLSSLLMFNESFSAQDADIWFAVTGAGVLAERAP